MIEFIFDHRSCTLDSVRRPADLPPL